MASALVAVFADVGLLGPDELIAGHALAGGSHAGEPEIGGVGQDGGEQRIAIIALAAGAKVGEPDEEPRLVGDVVQKLGDPDPGHERADLVRQFLGWRAGLGADRRDLQSAVDQLDAFQPAASDVVREPLQRVVERGRAFLDPGIGRRGQAEVGDHGRARRGREKVTVELAVGGRSLDPAIARPQLVPDVRQGRGLVQAAVDLAIIAYQQLAPFFAKRHRRARRHVALARSV